MLPKASTQVSTMRSPASQLAMLSAKVTALPPGPALISCASASHWSGLRPLTTTFAPASASPTT